MSINKAEIERSVLDSLEQIRPFLIADGGDIEFVEITDDGVVKVKLLGACSDCSMSMMTLKAGVEEAVKKASPEVKEVVAVDMATIA
jgi:Fe-S cluster biogenesis protein NfuA